MTMSQPVSSYAFVKALIEAGFPIPQNCIDASLELPFEGVVSLEFRCAVNKEDLEKLANAVEIFCKRNAT